MPHGGGPELGRRRAQRVATLICCIALAGGCAAARPQGSARPTDIVVHRDIIYADRSGEALRADVYTPASGGPFPGVLVVHGGSWQRGNKERMRGIAERLARDGYVAVSIDYRLAPAHRYPAQLQDCQDAVRWMRRNAEWLLVDPIRIGGFGYSAGGHLVALLATAEPAESVEVAPRGTPEDTRLQAAVLGAAPTDLRRFRPNFIFNRLLGGPSDQLPGLYAAASPITSVTPDDPPMFLYHGAHDWMVDPSQSQIMVDALRRAHVPVEYYETRGGHFSTFLFDGDEVRHALAFLDRWLKEPPHAAL
jgi:acetyl esterase/lipase